MCVTLKLKFFYFTKHFTKTLVDIDDKTELKSGFTLRSNPGRTGNASPGSLVTKPKVLPRNCDAKRIGNISVYPNELPEPRQL